MFDAGCSLADLGVGVESPWHHRIVPSFPASLILVVGQAAEESWPRGADATEERYSEEVVEVSTSCAAELEETLEEAVE